MKTNRTETVKARNSMTVLGQPSDGGSPIRAENIFTFPDGIPAFEDVHEFVFISKEDTQPFIFMKALNVKDLIFACVDPFIVYPGYAPRISDPDMRLLQAERPTDIFLLVIVTITEDARDITANMQAPVLVNLRKNIGKQIICDGQNYPVRHRIWDTMTATEANRQDVLAQDVPVTADMVH